MQRVLPKGFRRKPPPIPTSWPNGSAVFAASAPKNRHGEPEGKEGYLGRTVRAYNGYLVYAWANGSYRQAKPVLDHVTALQALVGGR